MNDGPPTRIELRIHGRVQGVWFREHTRTAARSLGLVGQVRNLPDGTVAAVAEGPRDACAQFETWCWTGSPMSEVTCVDHHWTDATGAYGAFDVVFR